MVKMFQFLPLIWQVCIHSAARNLRWNCFRFRTLCHKICNHPYFSNVVLACILISSAMLAAEDPLRSDSPRNQVSCLIAVVKICGEVTALCLILVDQLSPRWWSASLLFHCSKSAVTILVKYSFVIPYWLKWYSLSLVLLLQVSCVHAVVKR